LSPNATRTKGKPLAIVREYARGEGERRSTWVSKWDRNKLKTEKVEVSFIMGRRGGNAHLKITSKRTRKVRKNVDKTQTRGEQNSESRRPSLKGGLRK